MPGTSPRSGRPLIFPFPDPVIATVLRLRLALPDDTLVRLLNTSPSTIRRTAKETRRLLEQLGHVVEPATPMPLSPDPGWVLTASTRVKTAC